MDPRLYKAAKSGNIYFLIQLLNQNPVLLTKLTPQENTPLHIAVKFGHKNIVAEIYRRRMSLLIRPNFNGDTPLHVAARYGHFSIVDFLVKQILSTSWTDDEKRKNDKFEKLALGNKDNNTVLHEAVRNGHLNVVELLLKVDPKLACLENHAGESPLFLAAREGMKGIFNQILMSNPSSAHGGSDGLTALHAAVLERHSDVMEDLLRAKPQLITKADHHGRTPLHYVASFGDYKAVQRLLETDTSIAYVLDKDGHSPLHIAAKKGHTNVIEQIIRLCPDCGEILDLNGRNALHFAVLSGKAKVVRYMLETEEIEELINQSDNDGNTPLHLATIERKTWIVCYLMWDRRVNQRARNKSGQSVFDIDKSMRESCNTFPRGLITSLWRKISTPPTRFANEMNADGEAIATVKTYKKMGDTLLLVATLITTLTFAAAFTMPGYINNNVSLDQGMALPNSKILKWFLVSDAIAMASSMAAACVIFWGAVGSNKFYIYCFASAIVLTCIALESTLVAFTSGIMVFLPDQSFVFDMSSGVSCAFHVSTCLLVFQLVKIFHIPEICQLLVYRFCKIKYKIKK